MPGCEAPTACQQLGDDDRLSRCDELLYFPNYARVILCCKLILSQEVHQNRTSMVQSEQDFHGPVVTADRDRMVRKPGMALVHKVRKR